MGQSYENSIVVVPMDRSIDGNPHSILIPRENVDGSKDGTLGIFLTNIDYYNNNIKVSTHKKGRVELIYESGVNERQYSYSGTDYNRDKSEVYYQYGVRYLETAGNQQRSISIVCTKDSAGNITVEPKMYLNMNDSGTPKSISISIPVEQLEESMAALTQYPLVSNLIGHVTGCIPLGSYGGKSDRKYLEMDKSYNDFLELAKKQPRQEIVDSLNEILQTFFGFGENTESLVPTPAESAALQRETEARQK